MMSSRIPVVVLTPVKNEEWILERFIQVTSKFADKIIIADQYSTDKTKEIAMKYNKVDFIVNESPVYDENYRQNLLINRARELYPGPKLLIALDSDEFITADGIYSDQWNTITALEPGTRIFFKKPDILPGFKEYIHYKDNFYLGFIDDGSPHNGKLIHSPRLPVSSGETKSFTAEDITFMHFSLVRDLEYKARQRLYAVMEKQKKSSSWQIRLRMYSPSLQRLGYQKNLRPVPDSWTADFLAEGIDVVHFTSTELNQYNRQILEHFIQHGASKFWWEDIWQVDYNEIYAKLTAAGELQPAHFNIQQAPVMVNMLRKAAIKGLLQYNKWKHRG